MYISVKGTLAAFAFRKRKHKDIEQSRKQSEADGINELQNNQSQRRNQNGVSQVNGNIKSKKNKKDVKDFRKKGKNK